MNPLQIGTIDAEALSLSPVEATARLGCPPETIPLVPRCLCEVKRAIRCRYAYRRLSILRPSEDMLDLGFGAFHSHALTLTAFFYAFPSYPKLSISFPTHSPLPSPRPPAILSNPRSAVPCHTVRASAPATVISPYTYNLPFLPLLMPNASSASPFPPHYSCHPSNR